MYSSANPLTGHVSRIGRKRAVFVNLPTIIQIALKPRLGLSPVTKSMVTSSHFLCCTGRGWSSPPDLQCSILTCWQVAHGVINPATSALALPITTTSQILVRLLVPGCTDYGVQCLPQKSYGSTPQQRYPDAIIPSQRSICS